MEKNGAGKRAVRLGDSLGGLRNYDTLFMAIDNPISRTDRSLSTAYSFSDK